MFGLLRLLLLHVAVAFVVAAVTPSDSSQKSVQQNGLTRALPLSEERPYRHEVERVSHAPTVRLQVVLLEFEPVQ